jgi:DNA-binding HxlR family transcriptional regulator
VVGCYKQIVLIDGQVQGKGTRVRAGAFALTLLSVPLNVHVLKALEGGPKPLIDLRRVVGSPPQTTMRGHLQALTELGVLERRRVTDFPGKVEYELTRSGRELIALGEVVQAWLNLAPDQPLALGGVAAKSVIKALIEGWTSSLVRALAARPLALTELDRLIGSLNYPSLERRLSAMRLAGLIEVCRSEGRRTPYTVTTWLRQAMGPLVAAASWERQQLSSNVVPLTRIDFEATFFLGVPLAELPSDLSGSCRLSVEFPNGSRGEPVGVMVGVRRGQIESCVSRLRGHPDAWASGSTAAWLQAVRLRDEDLLEVGGDWALAKALIEQIHRAFFATSAPTPTARASP